MQVIQLYTGKKPCSYGIYCPSYSAVTFVLNSMLFPKMNTVYFYIITFRSTCAVSTMAVFWSP